MKLSAVVLLRDMYWSNEYRVECSGMAQGYVLSFHALVYVQLSLDHEILVKVK